MHKKPQGPGDGSFVQVLGTIGPSEASWSAAPGAGQGSFPWRSAVGGKGWHRDCWGSQEIRTSASSTTYHLGSTPEEAAPFRASPEMAVAPAWRHTDGGLGGKEVDGCKGPCGLVMQEECKALLWGNGCPKHQGLVGITVGPVAVSGRGDLL